MRTSDLVLVLAYLNSVYISVVLLISMPTISSGASLWTTLESIRRLQHIFTQVEVKYDPDCSATTPIILHLRPHPDLLFSGHHQRLRTICCRRLRHLHPPVTLRYKNSVLSSSEEVLR